jgi:hypothetical protein
MRQFQIQACVLFDRPYKQEELFEDPIPVSDDTSSAEAVQLADQPLIGYYTTQYASAQSMAEAVSYVEEALTTDEDMPESRVYDVACTEVRFEEVDPDIREEATNPDIPGIWFEGGMGFFSEIEIEHPHPHEH